MMVRLCSLKTCVLVLVIAVSWPHAAAAQDCTGPNGQEGAILYNSGYQTFQGCAGGTWVAFHKPGCPEGDGCPPPPINCDNVGDTCSDGTIYAGDSPDGDVPMYTTDANQSSGASWGTDGFTTGATSTVTGQANSADVYAHVQAGDGNYNPDDGNTPNALVLCEELSAHGQEDWYLPAEDELVILFDNKNTGDLDGTFGYGYYWSSTETDSGLARRYNPSSSGMTDGYKRNQQNVRCVRR